MIEVIIPMDINADKLISWLRDNVPASDWEWNIGVNGVLLENEQDATVFRLMFDL